MRYATKKSKMPRFRVFDPLNDKAIAGTWNGDRLGIFASAICLVHCLALPGLMSLLPLFVSEHSSVFFHRLMLFLIVPTTVYALWNGARRHHSLLPLLFATIGIVLLVSEVSLHEMAYTSSHLLAPIGGAFLIICHLLNIRSCRHSDSCATKRC